MATYYVDPAAGGANDGSSWTDAWTDIQSAFDNVTSGNTVYCRGTQTLTANIDIDTNNGANTGLIRYVGANGSGTVDGTYFTLDCNGAYSVNMSLSSHIFENFRVTNSDAVGWDCASGKSNQSIFVNCSFDTCGSHGYGNASVTHSSVSLFLGCCFYNNTADGFRYPGALTRFVACSFFGNGGWGLYAQTSSDYAVFLGCIFHDNTSGGIYRVDAHTTYLHNVFDGTDAASGVGLDTVDYQAMLFNRFTNFSSGTALDSNAGTGQNLSFCLFHNNSTDILLPNNLHNISYKNDIGAGSHQGSQPGASNKADPDAGDGYQDASSDDFNLDKDYTYSGDGDDVITMGLG